MVEILAVFLIDFKVKIARILKLWIFDKIYGFDLWKFSLKIYLKLKRSGEAHKILEKHLRA